MIDRYWLLLAQEFGLMPWDLDRLTYWQLQSACRAAEQILSAAKESGRGGKGG